MPLIKFIRAHRFKNILCNKNLESLCLYLPDELLLQYSCISGMLPLHKILQGKIETRTLLRHTTNKQASRRNRLTDAERLILCVLLLTQGGASYFPVDSVTSVTLGVVHKYRSTGVCLLQSSKNNG